MRFLSLTCVFSLACGEVNTAIDAATTDAQLTCESDETICEGECVNTNNDPEHCGSCSPCNLESATAGCIQGQCVLAACTAGFCDGDGTGGCELQPDFQTDPMNCGGCGRVCGVGNCVAGACALRVFVTKKTYPANLGGLDGADEICQLEANGHGLTGVYKAWLADDTGSPSTRFNMTGSYVRASDPAVVLADDFADLIDGSLDSAVLTHPDGVIPAAGFCWTNTAIGGGAAGSSHCLNWTLIDAGVFGSHSQHNLTSGLTGSGTQNCNTLARLFCVEQ